MSEYTEQFQTQFETLAVNESRVGRRVYDIVDTPDSALLNAYQEVADCIGEKTADDIGVKFTNNSSLSRANTLGYGRPASAYYSTLDDKLYVEWGQVDSSSGEAKLHAKMRNDPEYVKRKAAGAKTFSGHLGVVTLPECGNKEITVALFDSICIDRSITKDSLEYPLVTTLIANGVFPVGSDGFPVRLS